MKLIEGLKKIKELQRKADDLREKVRKHCAISTMETPLYADQKAKVGGWIQAHSDILKEILKLRIAIQRTNLVTEVGIELNGKTVTKTIAEWIHRRRDLAALDLDMYRGLTDKNIKEGVATGPGGTEIQIKIVRFYDPETKDKMVEAYTAEPMIIDARLEIANAVTDLMLMD